MRPRILVIGNTFLENEIHVDGVPMSGYSAVASAYTETIGGRGAESAMAAGKLSGNAILLGRVGEDSAGKRIREFLKVRGVDVRFLFVMKNEKTSVNTLIFDGSDYRTLYFPGANRYISMKDAENAFICNPEAVYLHFDVPYEVVVAASRFAALKKIPVFLSAGPVCRDFPFDLLENVNTIFLDELEVKKYTAVSVSSMEGCMKAAVEMRAKTGASCIVIKRGEKGVFINYGKYYRAIQAYNIKAEDMSFSDAAFDVAFITSYLRHGVYERACEYANIVGTLTASKAGKLASVPDMQAVKEFARVNCPDLLLED